MDDVFKALADPNRRKLLDRLFRRDGRTLGELCERVDMTRFGVMKHLRVLEEAGVALTRRPGGAKAPFPIPPPPPPGRGPRGGEDLPPPPGPPRRDQTRGSHDTAQ